ncbi:hypothetical protein [Aurantivibrio infirmus]
MNLEDKLVQELSDNEQVMQVIPAKDLFNEWEAVKNVAQIGAGSVTPIMDSAKATKIIKELGFDANKVLVKTYAGKQYIILKGYAGKREILQGTRYLSSNPKVVRMAIGPKGIAKSVKVGFVVTFVLSASIEILDYVLKDEASLAELLGNLSADFIKIGLSSVAGLAAGMAVGSAAVLGSVAAAPLIAAIAVGVVTGIVLDKIDKRFGATAALIEAYKQIGMDLAQIKYEVNRHLNYYERNPQMLQCLFAPCWGSPSY